MSTLSKSSPSSWEVWINPMTFLFFTPRHKSLLCLSALALTEPCNSTNFHIHPILSIPIATTSVKWAFLTSTSRGPQVPQQHNADLGGVLHMNKTVPDLQGHATSRLSGSSPHWGPLGLLCRLSPTTQTSGSLPTSDKMQFQPSQDQHSETPHC